MPGQCRRCTGKGEVFYRYGKPGQYRVPYSEVEWEDGGGWKPCPACVGTGWGSTPRKQQPERGSLVLHATESQLAKALKRLPTKRRNARS